MLIKHSVIIPIKDEEHNIPILAAEVEEVMNKLNEPWELIYIDDGSKDNSLSILKKLQEQMPTLRVLSFKKNYGQSSAFDAGFKLASGELIITLDGDLQNDPKDIPKLLDALEKNDMVCGWRQKRKDTIFKRIISKPSNIVRSRLCKDQIHDTGCSLKVFRKSSLSKIRGFHGMHRFFPALFKVEGMSVGEVKVSHRARTQGKSKYHLFNRSIGPMLDMFVVYWMRKRRLRYKVNEDV
ncbi:MAG: Dodecaprenyl-phosphate galacturonate synthase [Chlamydiae bacterium]|nr:Dodecaprenyl-phosphate galacturonate synthase [Chlamydiota bacterium]